jgi:hypothetical protein
MTTPNWLLPDRSPRCLFADSLYRTGQALLHQLAGSVTEETLAAGQEALARYRTELAAKLYPMHFGVSVGRHVCVKDVYAEAVATLRCLAVTMQPAPEPPPAPPPTPSSPSLEDVVEQFEEELYLGEIKDDGEGERQA